MCNISVGIREDGRVEERVKSITNLMDTMSWSIEQAMTALKVPEEDKAIYKEELNK